MQQRGIRDFTCARIPTDVGEFQLCLYHPSPDHKEHLAIVMGDVQQRDDVLVRVHSECFTGDVLGSRRCDCGEQLQRALELVARAGMGVIIYLRQEGRGIGLLEKLKAYNLQDEGYDTVEANRLLGHADDSREYSAAAAMLQTLEVRSIQLLTNNPTKIDELQALGVVVKRRIPLPPQRVTADNEHYLRTKVERMRHLLNLNDIPYTNGVASHPTASPLDLLQNKSKRPLITLSYAQTLDGSITARRGQPLAISGAESLRLTHQIRAAHDGILVGIGTVLADDPSLTVRLVAGVHPRPIVVDSQLRLPLTARLLQSEPYPLIATTTKAPRSQQSQLERAGATVHRFPTDAHGRVSLPHLIQQLPAWGIQTLMVEGGAAIIGSFLEAQLVDNLIATVSMQLVGGLGAVGQPLAAMPRLDHPHQKMYGADWVIWGHVHY